MPNKTDKDYRFVVVTKEFADILKTHADKNGRNLTDQIEHWMQIAIAVDSHFAVTRDEDMDALKAGEDMLQRVVNYFVEQRNNLLKAKLEASTAPYYGVDPWNKGIVIRTNPDGTQTHGYWGENAKFIPKGQLMPFPSPDNDNKSKSNYQLLTTAVNRDIAAHGLSIKEQTPMLFGGVSGNGYHYRIATSGLEAVLTIYEKCSYKYILDTDTRTVTVVPDGEPVPGNKKET